MRLMPEMKMEQQLYLTPELAQAIELLQMNTLELATFIRQEMLDNPLLEIDSLDDAIDELASDTSISAESGAPVDDDRGFAYLQLPDQGESLYDDMRTQLATFGLPEKEYKICLEIIGCIDDNGYLDSGCQKIAQHMNVEVETVNHLVNLLQQSLFPPGLSARSLVECLQIQIDRDSSILDKTVAKEIIEFYLNDCAQGNFEKVAQAMDQDSDYIQQLYQAIQQYNPRPALTIGNYKAVYVVPDAILVRKEGMLNVELKEATAPSLNLSSYYMSLLRDANGELDDNTIEYLKKKLKRALWLINSIEQRRKTIEKVIRAIVKLQDKFFHAGLKALHPLTLEEVAEEIEMHASTVSRVVQDKYLATPQGTYPLKFFFPSGVDETSARYVENVIKKLIKGEDLDKPISDNRIAQILKSEYDVTLSRRTVTKYRLKLGIPSSKDRKISN